MVNVVQGMNSKPKFLQELAKLIEIRKTRSMTPWSYQLPFTIDADGDEVTISVTIP